MRGGTIIYNFYSCVLLDGGDVSDGRYYYIQFLYLCATRRRGR